MGQNLRGKMIMESGRVDIPQSNETSTMPRAFSSLVDVDVFAISDQGHVRPNNEDHYLVVRLGRAIETVLSNLTSNKPGYVFDETGHGFIVADGLGGHSAGEVASQEAIYILLNLALHTPTGILDGDQKSEIRSCGGCRIGSALSMQNCLNKLPRR